MHDLEITPLELKEKIDRGENVLLVDVREPWKYEQCRIAGAKLIPMGAIPANLQALDSGEEVICYCHHGMRSLDVAAWLRGQGVEKAKSLNGGIERWSAEIDPTVPRY
jgi:adenylyltransferase/sulfurtransferase